MSHLTTPDRCTQLSVQCISTRPHSLFVLTAAYIWPAVTYSFHSSEVWKEQKSESLDLVCSEDILLELHMAVFAMHPSMADRANLALCPSNNMISRAPPSWSHLSIVIPQRPSPLHRIPLEPACQHMKLEGA